MSATGPGIAERLKDLINGEVTACRVPGAAVAVVRDGKVLLAEGFGLRDVQRRRPVTGSTLFPIASCTKAFTATLLGGLVDQGLLDWDIPVRSYLPGLRLADPTATDQLTLRDMLSHRSGLPRHDLIWYGNNDLKRDQLVAALEHLEFSQPLRQSWQYNNLMYVTAGHLAGRMLDTSWEDAVAQRVFSPLGMTATSSSLQAFRRNTARSNGYIERDDQIDTISLDPGDVCGPAGSIVTNINDMALWVQYNLSGSAGSGTAKTATLPSAATLSQLHRPSMLLPHTPVQWHELRHQGYGLGWQIDDYRGNTVVSHGGNLDGFSAMVSFLPDHGIGVAVLTNLNTTPLRDIVPNLIFDELLELPPVPWGTRYRDLYEALIHGPNQASDHRLTHSAGVASTRAGAELAGDYHHPGYGTLSIRATGTELTAELHGLPLIVRHVNHDAFELRSDGLDARFAARFEADFSGEIASVAVILEEAAHAIVFQRQQHPLPASVVAQLVGHYRLGPLDALVERTDSALTLTIGDSPAMKLEHHKDTTFRLANQPNTTAEFVVQGRRKAHELVIWPAGVFTRASSQR